MSKTIGYILAVIGLAATAISYKEVQNVISFTLPASIPGDYLFYGGIALVIIGALLVVKRATHRGSNSPEVPIYHGDRVVGYRRTAR